MTNQWFLNELKTALASLYDPVMLRGSLLIELLGVSQRQDPAAGLRGALTNSIEALRPSGATPQASRAWRAYQILRRRYIEGLGQRQIASDLGLGVRQLQREEKLARELLAEQIWNAYGLRDKDLQDRWLRDQSPPVVVAEPDDGREPPDEPAEDPVAEELEWLRSSVPIQLTAVAGLIEDVLKTVEPLIRKSSVAVTCHMPPTQHVPLRASVLRQALLDIISTVLSYAPGGRLHIEVQCVLQSFRISLRAYHGSHSAPVSAPAAAADEVESLAMAERLVQICDGELQITTPAEQGYDSDLVFSACLAIRVVEHGLVLVIDDNADSLHLIQRYLGGSPYLFIGAQDARSGMDLAVQHQPSAVLLDIMMPDQDGWSVLAQLREHLQTSHIPVIVCTLLSQRDLALAFGAAGFLRKPINRAELLVALDQLDLLSAPAPSAL